MLFTLKKIVGGLLLPLPFLLTAMAIALLLLWFTRWQKSAKVLMTVSWLTLLLISLQPVADRLLMPLETRFPTYSPKAQGEPHIEYIVVLGGGYTYNSEWAPSSNLFPNSLPRVAEGVRLHRLIPGSKLVFTGAYAESNPVASATVAAMVAESLGVDKQNVIALDRAKDTIEESQAVAELVNGNPFLLVTSANHLPRAVKIFQNAGLNPIPVPANQMATYGPLNPWEKAFPSALYLSHSERLIVRNAGKLVAKNQRVAADAPPVTYRRAVPDLKTMAQSLSDPEQVFRRINPHGRHLFSLVHVDLFAVPEHPKLFQHFNLLKGLGCQLT